MRSVYVGGGGLSGLTSSFEIIVSGEDFISDTLLASSNTLILFVFISVIITSESSIIEQFSFEFILRRFDGDAPSTVIDTELVRLAVGIKVVDC